MSIFPGFTCHFSIFNLDVHGVSSSWSDWSPLVHWISNRSHLNLGICLWKFRAKIKNKNPAAVAAQNEPRSLKQTRVFVSMNFPRLVVSSSVTNLYWILKSCCIPADTPISWPLLSCARQKRTFVSSGQSLSWIVYAQIHGPLKALLFYLLLTETRRMQNFMTIFSPGVSQIMSGSGQRRLPCRT